MAKEMLIGADQLQRTLRALAGAAPGIAAGALYREAERIMTAAKRLTPILTGALKGSGQVVPPTETARGASVTMGFGNSAIGYAVHVHENLQAHHPVGQAKFLEQPLNEARSGMDARLAEDVRREIARAAR